MRTLAMINLKGGVGKTVSAVNIAHILAIVHRKKVLLVDGDKQGNVSQHFHMYGGQEGTAAVLLAPGQDIAETIYPTQYKGLDVITSNMELYEADRLLFDESDNAFALHKALDQVKHDYDFCVIDNGPSVDTVALNVLVAADDVLVPIRPDLFSIMGLVDLVEQINDVQKELNKNLTLQGAFFTHWQNRDAFLQARETLNKGNICPVLQTTVSYNIKVPESTLASRPLNDFAPRCWAALQYRRLVEEYLSLVALNT